MRDHRVPATLRSIHGRFRFGRALASAVAVTVMASMWPAASAQPSGCLPWGDQDTINARLQAPGDVAVLCQRAIFELTAPVVFTAPGQQLFTEGHPTDDRRAVLRVTGPRQTTAIVATDVSDVLIAHLVIDGNRPQLGPRRGQALVFAGGSASGQVIRANRILEPRSWSALHVFEGPEPRCSGALVEDNVIGPAGTYDGDWADGISFACTDSVVRRNTIVDVTDGAIVVFGAPGSVIHDNLIRAETRVLLGGINMVDYAPYDGDFTGTVVRDNLIEAAGATIRVGLGMGWRVWACLEGAEDAADPTLYGATVTGNELRGAPFQYGFVVAGVRDWTVTGNRSTAVHTGVPDAACRGRVASPPAPFLVQRSHASGTFQAEFRDGTVEMALWAISDPPPLEPR